MTKKIVILLVMILACGLLLAGSATAANGFAIPRQVIGGGGQHAAGDGYILHGTIGELVASSFAQGATYGFSSGFWWLPQYRIYMPMVLKNE